MGGKLGLTEILLILAIALLLFGPSKLADLGKGLGEGIKNFKSAVKNDELFIGASPGLVPGSPGPGRRFNQGAKTKGGVRKNAPFFLRLFRALCSRPRRRFFRCRSWPRRNPSSRLPSSH